MLRKLSKASLLPDYQSTGDIALQNQNTLRKMVGALGILLPLIVYLFLQITDDFDPVLPSISHYYFTRSSSFFEIIVSLLAVFLLIYKGEKFIDYILSSLAGLSALLMLIFPTSNLWGLMQGKYDLVAVTCFKQSEFRPKFHYGCAAIFLICLALISLLLFTKSSQSPSHRTQRKKIRNWIYRGCAIIMFSALLVAFLGFLGTIDEKYYDSHNMTFWMEVISVEAFGLSWMVKGGFIFQDKIKIDL
ncbi:MAG: hypothetical protein QM802_26540 [Agriterribacter sp.]